MKVDPYALSSTGPHGHFYVDASSLRLPPGRYPQELTLRGVPLQLSEAQRDADGDVQGVVYRSRDGSIRLLVGND